MIDKLDNLLEDISSLNSKLVLLIGPPGSGKSGLLAQLGERRQAQVLNVGAVLGRALLSIPGTRRHLQTVDLLNGLASQAQSDGVLLMDNIELLFDQALQLNPLDLLKRHAHGRCVVAAWPGELRAGRLLYAATGHREFRDCGIDGLVPFEIH